MGTHRDARVSHAKKIDKLRAEVARLEAAKAKEAEAKADVDADISKLALKAAAGDRDALSRQRGLRERRDEYRIQGENLEAIALPIRQELGQAESELHRFELAEACEAAAQQIAELPALTVNLSEIISPVARQFGAFRERFDATMAQALRLADPERIRAFEGKARTTVFRGLRAQIARDFESQHLHILEVSDDGDFASVVEPVLRSMIAALEVTLYTGNTTTVPGRANFRCTTNISGLFGMHLKFGDVVSLPVADPDVKKMIASGALELFDEPTTLSAEAHA